MKILLKIKQKKIFKMNKNSIKKKKKLNRQNKNFKMN